MRKNIFIQRYNHNFLSNGGIICHAVRMTKVDKGEWDKSKGVNENHEFNLSWLY